VDTHCHAGYEVPATYDSLLAKLICHGSDREEAIETMRRALGRFTIDGVESTVDFQRFVLGHQDFAGNRQNTRWVDRIWTTDGTA
jgi:acetyl-CoA carboxylase biotin carboxylase subunit